MSLNKQQLEAVNQANFPDNNSKFITPELLREFNTDMIDAIQLTGSYATTGSNTFVGNQTITGNLNVSGVISASVLYVQTETASVIYSSGSNQLGDELTDIQTLSGSVKIQGQLLINGVPLTSGSTTDTGSLVTTASFNAYTQSTDLRLNSLETNSASVNVSISNLNTTTASLNTSVTALNQFTQSQNGLNGTFATTGSNTFTGNQIIDRASKLYTNGVYWTDMTAGFNNLEIINQGGGNLDFASLNGGRMRVVNTPLQLTGSVLSSNSDISTSANIYGANLITSTDLTNLSASLTITDEFLQAQIDALDTSGSAASVAALNVFTASQLIINTGYNTFTQSADGRLDSLESTTASLLIETQNLELFSASALTSISNLNASSASQQVSINNLNAATSSYVTETESGSFLLTASFDNGTRNLTFTKGNNTTFNVNIPDVSGSTLPTGVISGSAQITALGFVSSSVTASSLITASAAGSTITFTKGDNTQFNVTLDTGSATSSPTIFEVVYTGENITKGDPLYISGSQGANPTVFKADAAVPAKMPVTFVANETIGVNNTTNAIILGLIEGIDLTGYVAGQAIYVAEGGGWSINLPSGSNSITQLLGVVTKAGNGGKGLVLNPGPAQLPGLDTGKMWVGNGNNQPIEITTASFASSASFNSYTSSTNSRLTNIESTTASLLIETQNLELFSASALSSISQLNASSASQQISINNLNTTTASLLIETQNLELFSASALVSISNLNASSASQQISINSLNAATASYVTETESGSFLITASFDNGTRNLTFTKGNNTTFAVNIPDVSGSGTINTGSFATTGSNAFFGINTFSGAVSFTGSAPSILSSSFSGSLITNLTDIYTDIPAVQQIVTLTSASYAALLSGSLTNPNTLYIVSGSGGSGGTTDITALNAFTASQYVSNSFFATTGSNAFVGDQYVSNGVLQVATYPQTGKTWFAPTAIEAVGTQSVAYEQFVDGGGYDCFNVVSTLDSGSEFRDLPSDTFVLNTWLQIPRNTGNNPAPQFKRGLSVTGSTNIQNLTASLQQGYVWVGGAGNVSTLVATSSFGGGGSINTGSFATTGSNNFIGNQVISGSLLVSGSDSNDLTVEGRILITGSATVGLTPQLRIEGSDGGFTIIGKGGNNINTTKVTSTSDANTQVYANTSSVAGMYMGVYDDPNFNTDVEVAIIVSNSGSTFNDWDNGTTFSYVPFLTVAPNVGNNPTPVMTRGLNVTGSVNITGQYLVNGVPISGSGGTISTGSFAITGSNVFNGAQIVNNFPLQVSNYNEPNLQAVSPTVFQGVGTASVAYEQYINAGNYDAIHIQSNLNAGTDFQDLPSDTFVLNTWLNIPTNTGNNPAPQFKRGLSVTGSTNIQQLTASLQQGHLFVGNASGRTTTVATSSFVSTNQTGSFALLGGSNIFTAQNTFQNQTRYEGSTQSDSFANIQFVNNQSLVTSAKSTLNTGQTGSFQVMSMTTGSGGNASFQMTAEISGTVGQLKVTNNAGSTTVAGLADTILFAKNEGFPNTPATTFTAEATSIKLVGDIQFESGSNKTTGLVTADASGTTVSNSLVTANSMIFLTPQALDSGGNPVDRFTVYDKTTGSFKVKTDNGAASTQFAYLIINPTT
jgi:hypothetical protein